MFRRHLLYGNNQQSRTQANPTSKRIKKDSYTSSRLPVELIYCELFTDFNQAIEWEKKIKNWSRAEKEALVKQNWEKLKESSECRNETTYKNTYRYIKR